MNQAEAPVRAVIFDYGHTLVDFTVPQDALHEVYREIRERLSLEASAELPDAVALVDHVSGAVYRRIEESYATDRLIELDVIELFTTALQGLGFEPKTETVRWVAEAEHSASATYLVAPQETLDVLSGLKEANLKVGIISNAHFLPYMMRADWDRLGIGAYLDASIISSEVGIRKPHKRIFGQLLETLDVRADETLFVGDRLFDDVGGSQSVGMRAVLTRQFRQEEIGPETAQPDFVVDSISGVLPIALPASVGHPR